VRETLASHGFTYLTIINWELTFSLLVNLGRAPHFQ
jgi:hypothetical protein